MAWTFATHLIGLVLISFLEELRPDGMYDPDEYPRQAEFQTHVGKQQEQHHAPSQQFCGMIIRGAQLRDKYLSKASAVTHSKPPNS